MKPNQPILIIEDDIDDQELLKQVFDELNVKNPLLFFDRATKLLEYLLHTKETIFLILCDVNIPGTSGIELRRMIDADEYLRMKSIPFTFYTTTAVQSEVNKAYQMMVQGYFEKPHDYEKIKALMKKIIDYWTVCIHPNNWM